MELTISKANTNLAASFATICFVHLKYKVDDHSGDKPYGCSVCVRKFSETGRLVTRRMNNAYSQWTYQECLTVRLQQILRKLSYWKDFNTTELAIKTLIKSFKIH